MGGHNALQRGQGVRGREGGERGLHRDSRRGNRLLPGAVRLREDHHPPDDRRFRTPHCGRDLHRGPARPLGKASCPPGAAQPGNGVPELRGLAPYDRVRQRGLPAQAAQGAQAQAAGEGDEDPGDGGAYGPRKALPRTALRWPAATGGPGPRPGGGAGGHAARRAPVEPGRQTAGEAP